MYMIDIQRYTTSPFIHLTRIVRIVIINYIQYIVSRCSSQVVKSGFKSRSITITYINIINRVSGKFEDIKRVVRSLKLKIHRQHNAQKKRDKKTNNYLQTITQKTKDRATRTPLKTESAPEGLEVVAPHVAPIVLLLYNFRVDEDFN